MHIAGPKLPVTGDDIGQAIYDLIAELYPICRSITGDGVRQTLRRLQQIIRMEIHEVPSSTQVFDWTVPKEWNIRDAWVKDRNGERASTTLHMLLPPII